MTQIFKNYAEFLSRENKKINGVSSEFVKQYPDYETQNISNEGCWNCSDCRGCNGCSDCSDCRGCIYCSDCRGCIYCSDCSDCNGCSDCSDCRGCIYCSDCSDCNGCSYCSDCRGCSEKNGVNETMSVPIIENIHQKVLEAVSIPGAFDMSDWHKCETTHCRAGWVEVLAGDAGKRLAKKTSTAFAAMQIYKKSSTIRVSPVRFYEDNETAMKDIIRCAEEEKKL